MGKHILSILLPLLLSTWGIVSAQEQHTEIRLKFRVNSVVVEPHYGDNAAQLNRIDAIIERIKRDSTLLLDKVILYGSASPEGSWKKNHQLAQQRAQTIEHIIKSKIELSDSLVVQNDMDIPWEYLKAQVSESVFPHKNEIIDAINTPLGDNGNPINRITNIRSINDGIVWWQLSDLYFPDMREAYALFLFKKQAITTIPTNVITEVEPPVLLANSEPNVQNRRGGDFRGLYI